MPLQALCHLLLLSHARCTVGEKLKQVQTAKGRLAAKMKLQLFPSSAVSPFITIEADAAQL